MNSLDKSFFKKERNLRRIQPQCGRVISVVSSFI